MVTNSRVEELEAFKTRVDRLLCGFFAARVGRGPKNLRRRTARALWEMVARRLPEDLPDAPWPFWRFCVRLLDRAATQDVRGNEPELTLDLLALGFPDNRNALDKWKHDVKEQWGKCLANDNCRVAFDDREFLTKAFDILALVRENRLASGLTEARDALGIRTDWDEALFSAIRGLSSGGAARRIVALYPPGHERLLPGVCAAVLNEFSARAIRVALEEQEELLPILDSWERQSPAPWLAVIPEAERFADLDQALKRIYQAGWNALVICRAENSLGETWDSAGAIVLGRLDTDQELAEEEEEIFKHVRQLTQRQDVFDTLCLFTALHRKPLVSQVARICGIEEKEVREIVDNSGGLLAVDPSDSRKVMFGHEGWAARHLFRLHSLEELAAKYAAVLERLRPEDAEDRRAVRNLFTTWFRQRRGPECPLRLARAVAAESRGRVFDFARCEPRDATSARLLWTEILAWMGEYQEAHDLLLETDRGSDRTAVETLNADIFKARFRDSGRTLFYRLGESIYMELINSSPAPAALDSLREKLADLYRLAGEPAKGLAQLNRLQAPASEYRRSIHADLLRAAGRPQQAESEAKKISGSRLHPVLLEDLRGDEWRAYVKYLEQQGGSLPPAAFEQAAVRALERGLFDDANRLLALGLAIDPDNLYLNASLAKLYHELGQFRDALRQYDHILPKQGAFGGLTGPEADVIRLARLDSAVELFRTTGDKGYLPQHLPAPLTLGKPPRDQRAESYYLHLVTLEAKLYWYGVKPFEQGLEHLANRLVAVQRHPVLLNLAAKILADDSVRGFQQARQYIEEALNSVQGQMRIRTLNNLAWVLEREAQYQSKPEGRKRCLEDALAKLQESAQIDAENGYTCQALSRISGLLAACVE